MDKIATYIFKKYGYLLTSQELQVVINWYNANKSTLTTEATLDAKLRAFLAQAFPNHEKHLFAEDTSNMNYLLMMLKDTTGNK